MFYIVLYMVKLIQKVMKLMHRNATNLPGKIAVTLYPKFLKKIGKPKTIVAITGTDGKTTVNNLTIDSLEQAGYKVLHNKLGSNIDGGIASSFLSGVNLKNQSQYDIAVLEVDERSAPKIYPYVTPTYLICTNLFRDSIYRNAHPQFIFDIMNKEIPEETKLILNADDPISSQLGEKNEKIFFAIDKQPTDKDEPENIINDLRVCPKCYTKLKYNYSRYNHVGNVYCPNCDFKSPEHDYEVKEINYDKNYIIVNHNNNEIKYNSISNQMFNIYNEITVITFLSEFGVETKKIQEIMKNIKITGTRYNQEEFEGIKIVENVAKGLNSIACSCVFDSLRKDKADKEVIMLLDDFYEARDSSENITWLYDTDFEFLNENNIKKIIVGGKRAKDYELRLLLADIPREKIACETDEYKTPDDLSLNKNYEIYILYDIYNHKIKDRVKETIKERIRGDK